MNKKYIKLSAGILSLTMLLGSFPTPVKALEKQQVEPLKIGVMSDTHYFSQDLYAQCEDFNTAMNSDRKMLKESSAILDGTLQQMIQDQPDVVMISGDLTKDGEEINHRAVANKLKQAKKQLPQTQFYVINGNHDINNPHGKDFSSGQAEDANTTTVEEFKEIYKDFGYGNNTKQYKPNGNDAGSLSYVTSIKKGYTLIAVDSCKYSKDQTSNRKDIQETGGVISQDLLNWVNTEAKKAQAQGDVVMVLEHHGVIPHFSMEPTVMKDYLVDNYQQVSETFADAGVNYVFSGHMHANDIAEYTSKKGNKLYDIETGSLVTYPSLYRSVTIQAGNDHYQDGHYLTSEMKKPAPIQYKDFDTGEIKIIEDLTDYAKGLTLSKEVITTMINEGVLSPMIDDLMNQDGLKTLAAQLLQVPLEQVSPTLTNTITKLLPQNKEEGLPLTISSFNLVVYYNSETQAIMIDSANQTYQSQNEGVLTITTPEGEEIKITIPKDIQTVIKDKIQNSQPYGLFDNISLKIPNKNTTQLIDQLFDKLTNDFLKTNSIQTIVESFIGHLLDAKVDDTHSVYDVVETVYQMHLAGNEQAKPWLEAALLKIQEGQMLPQIIKQSINDTQPTLSTQLGKVNISLKDIVEPGNKSLVTSIAVKTINNMTLNGSQLIDSIDSIGNLIPQDILKPINDLAYQVAYSMSHDENYANDLNTTITYTGKIPWDQPPVPTPENNQSPTIPQDKPTTPNNQFPTIQPTTQSPTTPQNNQITPQTDDSTSWLLPLSLTLLSTSLLLFLRKKQTV